MRARLFQPAKTAMQSGPGRGKAWLLEVLPAKGRALDPLMGWTGAGDTAAQVRLRFASAEEARAYAAQKGWEVEEQPAQARRPNIRPRGYAENFVPERKGAWTH